MKFFTTRITVVTFFVITLLLLSNATHTYAQEYGKIHVIPPNEDCEVYIDSLQVGKGTIITRVKAGYRNVVVTLKDQTLIYDKSVYVNEGQIVTIPVEHETKASPPTQARESKTKDPTAKETIKQKKDKRFTVIPFYNFSHIINVNVSNNSYMDSGLRATYNLDFDVDAGLGLAIEGITYRSEDKRSETILGLSYSQRNSKTMNGKATLTGYLPINYRSTEINVKGAFTAYYAKLRYFVSERDDNANNTYMGGKLSYNMMKFTGDIVGTSNLWGYGIFMGVLFPNDYNLEVAFDTTTGSIDDFDDGYDTFKGTFTMASVLSVSLGYNF